MANATCSIEDCAKQARSRGWCPAHYERWRKHGDPMTVLPPVPPPTRRTQRPDCSVDGCTNRPLARNLCTAHYQRMRVHGDPTVVVRKRNSCRVGGCRRPAHGHLLCGRHYLRWRAHGDPGWVRPTFTTCVVQACGKPSRSATSPLCEMHYGRQRRTGSPLTVRQVTGRTTSSHGYILVRRPGHDLAHASGWAYEHRVVLLDAIGPGEHGCHWCGRLVSWELQYPMDMDALVVDHLDGVKDHNDPSNLVPSCNACNMARDRVA